MNLLSRRAIFAVSIAMVALGTGGCTKLRSHQGYIVDPDLANAVQPRVDNKQSVAATLGQPTFKSQFNDDEWYYVSRDSRNLAYNKPKPVSQTTLKVTFDGAGNVASIDKTGVEQVVSVDVYGKETPTLGRERGFFDDLFGNIGTVGSGVGGPGQQGGGNQAP